MLPKAGACHSAGTIYRLKRKRENALRACGPAARGASGRRKRWDRRAVDRQPPAAIDQTKAWRCLRRPNALSDPGQQPGDSGECRRTCESRRSDRDDGPYRGPARCASTPENTPAPTPEPPRNRESTKTSGTTANVPRSLQRSIQGGLLSLACPYNMFRNCTCAAAGRLRPGGARASAVAIAGGRRCVTPAPLEGPHGQTSERGAAPRAAARRPATSVRPTGTS